MSSTISIKGTREGLTITVGEGELPILLEDLTQHLATQGAFFRGGRVALQLGDREIDEKDLSRINTLLSEHEMLLRTVITTNKATQEVATSLGLRLLSPEPAQVVVTPPKASEVATAQEESKGILVRHLVRSGQVVRHTGHIVVVGDVNLGAQVIAGGDIVIWGKLNGMAYAGAMGNNHAVVCALELTPLQLRIGSLIARPDENDRRKTSHPEIAYVRNDTIVVEPWDRAPRGV